MEFKQGCLDYRWYKSETNSSDFPFFMAWESESVFQGHVKTKHVSNAEEELKEVLQKPYQDMGWPFLDPNIFHMAIWAHGEKGRP
jgi:quinol monooxygenase YgiN